MGALTDRDYARLLEVRTGLRRFLSWSASQAEAVGITPAQHQLLLAVRGSDEAGGPTVGSIAGLLFLKHHSVVELADRAEEAGLIRRTADPRDHRVVRLRLTPKGARTLERLSSLHLEELARLAPKVASVWAGLDARG